MASRVKKSKKAKRKRSRNYTGNAQFTHEICCFLQFSSTWNTLEICINHDDEGIQLLINEDLIDIFGQEHEFLSYVDLNQHSLH